MLTKGIMLLCRRLGFTFGCPAWLWEFGGQISTRGDLLKNTYTANALNEYTSITTPGYKDICGAAIATNSVAVNGGTADRKVEYK